MKESRSGNAPCACREVTARTDPVVKTSTALRAWGPARLVACALLAGAGGAGLAQTTNTPAPAAAQPPKPAAPRKALSVAARRNENTPVYQIDTNSIQEVNRRLGRFVRPVEEPRSELNYYATDLGRPASGAFLIPAATTQSTWHGEGFWWHQNSVFNARTFFQVGSVMPSHQNLYGGRASGEVGRLGLLTLGAGQQKIRGMVNGNVLVPLESERTPLATDPEVRAVVERFLGAYPEDLPNRPDFDPRALNTNSPQRIDQTNADIRLDRDFGEARRLSLDYSLTRTRIDAFQFVAGQNPDTEIHAPRARATYWHTFLPGTNLGLGFTFSRVRSLLKPEPNAVGPRVRVGFQIEELGPDSQFPIDRAENSFTYGALLSHLAGSGRHALTFGGDLTRFQLNGSETNNERGYFQFTNNYGRTAIENLLYGIPSKYEVSLGDFARGYRNWRADLFFGDRWQATPRLQVYWGLRYSLETVPVEVDGIDYLPYGCDCNNFSPRLSLALRLGAGWIARTSYVLSYGQIPPVTYQQVRNNVPRVRQIQVQDPDLLDPLQGIDLNDPNLRVVPTLLSPRLTSPYSHQYQLTLERRFLESYSLRLSYLGSRTVKLMYPYVTNRAEPVPGIPPTTATVDQRRADSRYYEVLNVANGGNAYFDAAQVAFDAGLRRGLALRASYTFGKALDSGADFTATAANRDLQRSRSQWQYESFRDRKGLSDFDSTHTLVLDFAYDLPRLTRMNGWAGAVTSGWQITGATLLRSGTPLTLYIGSDSPGFGNVDGSPSDRPNIVDPSILGATIAHPDSATQILRRDRFSFIRPGEPRGNVGKGAFRKAGIANLNLALSRQFRLRGDWLFLIRAEAYNSTNTPQFDEPQRNLSAPAFGKITNTLNDGRVFQLGCRLIL